MWINTLLLQEPLYCIIWKPFLIDNLHKNQRRKQYDEEEKED